MAQVPLPPPPQAHPTQNSSTALSVAPPLGPGRVLAVISCDSKQTCLLAPMMSERRDIAPLEAMMQCGGHSVGTQQRIWLNHSITCMALADGLALL